MKGLFLGIVLIVIIGIGGLVYRNALERSSRPITCPVDARVCPDGTAVGRTGLSCAFPACPPPNVTLAAADIAFAVPAGFTETGLPDEASIAAFESSSATNEPDSIVIRRYAIAASSTALTTIQETAIGGASGAPVPATSFTSTVIGTHRFTIVQIERFEAVVDTAYYLARGTDVLRFDAIDRGVLDWTDPGLDTATLPANIALRALLATLQGD